MKGAENSNDIVVKRPQPWNVFGRLDTLDSRLDTLDSRLDTLESDVVSIKTSINEIKTSLKSSQKMTAVMFVVTQVPVWMLLLKK